MNALDQWEAEANSTIEQAKHPCELWGVPTLKARRILALIELVRKKDEQIEFILRLCQVGEHKDWQVALELNKALALTDQLGKEDG